MQFVVSLPFFFLEKGELDLIAIVSRMIEQIENRRNDESNGMNATSAMTPSETEWSKVLALNGLNFTYEPGDRNATKPDFRFQLSCGTTVFSEVKECTPNELDRDVLSGHRLGFWGAREGRDQQRPSGRVDRTGWGGHFLKAAKQMAAASQDGFQTLVVFRSYSLTADFDGTDILLFLFGYHYRRTSATSFRIECEKWGDGYRPLPMASFDQFTNVSGLVYLKGQEFRLFANPLARVPLNSQSFACLAGCNQVSELDFASTYHAVWRNWEPGYTRLACDS